MVSSDFKRFIKYSYNLHDSRNSYNLHSSYNLHNSFDKERDKKRRKRRKKKETKDKRKSKNFAEEKKEKKCQHYHECNKNLSREHKKKLIEYRSKYYMAHNKLLLGHSVDFLKILGQLSFLFHGLVLEILKIF